MKHVLIINRYDDELSDFNKYIDHDAVHVSYISLTETMRYITSSNCYYIASLEQLNEEDVLKEAVKIYEKKPIDYVIAISEYDLDAAARIRTELNIVGATVEDNLLCRNKKKMKDALAHSTVRYPKYAEVSSHQDIEKFLLESGSAIILKPQVGAASEGVIKISELQDIPHLSSYAGYEVEEFIEGDIYHVDAIISDNKMPYFKVSKYINTCLDFRNGAPLGSVTIDNSEFIQKVERFTLDVCKFLKLKDQAIHLEFIESKGELVFLEVGGRVGGGEIPFITLRNESVDLYEMWIKAAMNIPLEPVNTKITGFLMMPNPYSSGFLFNGIKELENETITYQLIQESGDHNNFSYENIPAKIHFMGESQIQVEDAIKNSMKILQSAICQNHHSSLSLSESS